MAQNSRITNNLSGSKGYTSNQRKTVGTSVIPQKRKAGDAERSSDDEEKVPVKRTRAYN